MPNLSIKDVPEVLAEQLRRRAAANHRSLQGELMAILETAVATGGACRLAEPQPAEAYAEAARSAAVPGNSADRRRRVEEILARAREGFAAADRLRRDEAHQRR